MSKNTTGPETSFERSSTYECSAEQLYNWHARPGALERLLPAWENTSILSRRGGIEPGAEVVLKMHLGPFPFTFKAQHIEAVPCEMFRDVQSKGPFSSWSHSHFFQHTQTNQSSLKDKIDFKLYFQKVIPPFIPRLISKKLDRIFSYRIKLLQEDILLHKRCSAIPLNILISGASGILGRELLPLLTTGGHKVWTLVRRTPDPAKNEIYWEPETGVLNPGDLPQLDGVIHLAGEYIGLNRWTEKSKKRVIDSRVNGTDLLTRVISQLDKAPEVFLCASAVGYYGNCVDEWMNEDSPPGSDFISEVCAKWEQSTEPARAANIRTVFMRLGVGFTPKGGALRRILNTSPLGIHHQFGSGDQYISWISNDDMISAMLHVLTTTSLSGAINIAAPNPVTNRELMHTLSKITGRPQLFSIPSWPLRLAYGKMASEILLSGCRVSSEKLQRSGFKFRHSDLETALRFMLGKEI